MSLIWKIYFARRLDFFVNVLKLTGAKTSKFPGNLLIIMMKINTKNDNVNSNNNNDDSSIY